MSVIRQLQSSLRDGCLSSPSPALEESVCNLLGPPSGDSCVSHQGLCPGLNYDTPSELGWSQPHPTCSPDVRQWPFRDDHSMRLAPPMFLQRRFKQFRQLTTARRSCLRPILALKLHPDPSLA